MLKPWVILTNKFEFNEFKTSIMTDVWIVQYKQLDTGNRIEGFNVKFSVFTDRNNALQYAFTMARDFGNPDLEYNDKGRYVYKGDSEYDCWPELTISVKRSRFDPNAKVAFTLSASC